MPMIVGAARFENQSVEVALEMDITSDRNQVGEFTGRRTPFDNILGVCEGKGRLWCDMVWNEETHAYKEGVCFRWMDEQQGVMTVLEFNSVCDHLDTRHSFFEGVVMRFPAFADPNDPELEKVTQYGVFDFLCSSRKTHHTQSMELGEFCHEWLYADETSDQTPQEPKYVQRMFDYAEKIEEARSKKKRESLKLPEGDDWAGHLFGKSYSIKSPKNCKSTDKPQAKLDFQGPARRNSMIRPRVNTPLPNSPSPSPSYF
ncbi:hypothetical protein RFI_38232 [Reticulomyxa filosa]|uniref:Uncharacterized protein n=1 Tax=Reticulomyxa filosa TaxID=46433 RepID=X6LCZ1_RETFI|nr:hypothetical protein RFI_38232 [Reticulomyxa filosa]|eukprot:ETN99250.1 hypothetical protein RFI_38232 [Reticulomyxa filosa]